MIEKYWGELYLDDFINDRNNFILELDDLTLYQQGELMNFVIKYNSNDSNYLLNNISLKRYIDNCDNIKLSTIEKKLKLKNVFILTQLSEDAKKIDIKDVLFNKSNRFFDNNFLIIYTTRPNFILNDLLNYIRNSICHWNIVKKGDNLLLYSETADKKRPRLKFFLKLDKIDTLLGFIKDVEGFKLYSNFQN